jgi:hypothetical protein
MECELVCRTLYVHSRINANKSRLCDYEEKTYFACESCCPVLDAQTLCLSRGVRGVDCGEICSDTWCVV